jgi:hypothetical protein
MRFGPFLTASVLAGLALAATNEDYCAACKAVESAISDASNVHYPGKHEQLPRCQGGANTRTGDPLYSKGKYHFFATSEQDPACVVEPATPEDVGEIVRPSSILRCPRSHMPLLAASSK